MGVGRLANSASSPMRWSNYKKYVIGILLVVYTFNFIDRQIIAILSPAIKSDLGINDTQLGLLKGFAFALFYSVFSIPIARLADKENRVTIISVSLAFWSGMTALCGAAANFWHLLIARVGVGIGEAGCTPPAHSLVSDYFYKEERATALGLYSLGIPLGSLFGILFGGWLAGTLGWRWAFVTVGLPGVILAVIVKLTLKEPARGGAEPQAPLDGMQDDRGQKEDATNASVMRSFQIMWAVKSYRILIYGSSLVSFAVFGLNLWVVDFLFRTHELTYSELTLPLAFCIGIGGAVGTAAGGALCDMWGREKVSNYFLFIGLAHTISVPIFIFSIWTSSINMCFFALFFAFMLHSCIAGPCYALVQNLSPLEIRAFSAAFYMFVISLIGLGLGPVYIGVVSDMLAATMGEATGLQVALTSLAPVWMLAAILFIFGRGRLSQDLMQ